jgi:hypothetical protein
MQKPVLYYQLYFDIVNKTDPESFYGGLDMKLHVALYTMGRKMEIENIWHRELEIPEEFISSFIDILITDSD